MRVALSFPGCHRRGGVERVMFECARFLASRSHAVTVFANEWEPDSAQAIRYEKVGMQTRPTFLRGPSFYRECAKLLAADTTGFDVLNTHGCVCPTGGVHWVQSVHRSWLERSRAFRGAFSAASIKQRLNPLHPILLKLEDEHFRERRYRKVIATTEDVKDDLRRFYGVPGEDVVVVPNGFSPIEFNPHRAAARRTEMRDEYGLTPDNVVLLFVANELERKGYRTALSALQRLNDPRLRLMVVGRADTHAVREQAAAHGVAGQVLACGPTQDVAAFHAAADIFVLPTQYEAFCLAILEALGSGLPVVTTKIPGAHDAIKPGVNGFLIDDPRSGGQLAEMLRPLLEYNVRRGLADQAPDSVRQYQWPSVLARYEQVLLQHCG